MDRTNYKFRLRTDRVNKYGENALQLDIQYGNRQRKRFNVGLNLHKKDWSDVKQEIKESAIAYETLDRALTKLKNLTKENLRKYKTGDITIDQVEKRVTGKVDYASLTDYIQTELKSRLKPKTYSGYYNAVKKFGDYIGLQGKKVRFQDVNQTNLNKFKREFFKSVEGKKRNSNNSFNSYCTQLRASYNHAVDDGIVYTPLQYRRKYMMPKTATKWKQPTPEEFIDAISRINTLAQWESMALWLLAFCCRGFYWADFTSLRSINIDDYDKYKTWCESDAVYINHYRHKTKDTNPMEMIIKLDKYPTLPLLRTIKYSFAKRFFTRRPDFVPNVNDEVRIYNYTLEDNPKFHEDVINTYQKSLRDVWKGYPHKVARKVFKNVAKELDISSYIADLLVGHSPVGDMDTASYSKFDTPLFKKKIQEAHEKILDHFRVKEIADVLFDRLYEIMQVKSKQIPHWIYFEGRLTDSAGNMVYDFNWTNTSADKSDNEFRYGKYEPYWKDYKPLYEDDPNKPNYWEA